MSIDELFSIATGGQREIPKDWMPATMVRPFVFGDPALVWLQYHGKQNGFAPDEVPYNFLDFIAEKGCQFEGKWISELAKPAVVVCLQDYQVRSIEKVRETVEQICSRTPLIAKPALWWAPERVYGVPDLIVHTSWLAEKFPQFITQYERDSLAVNLDPQGGAGHYVVFDIKFTSGLEESGKKTAFANYYAQVRIYSFMLGQLQGLMPRNAFLVTRDRLFDPLPTKIISTLGDPLDADLVAIRDQFVEIRLRGSKYSPWKDAIVSSDVSNQDDRWLTAKDVIAREKFPGRDPALLYQVSPSIKEELNGMGFPSLDSMLAVDPMKVPFEKCKGLGPKRSKIMRAILDANHSGGAVRPDVHTLLPQRQNEFFIDFEYFTNINVDFEKQWPGLEGYEMVFMIGLGQNAEGAWSLRSFVAGGENAEHEREMFLQFIDFLNRETDGAVADPSKTALYHWTGAEAWQARRASDRLAFAADHPLRTLPWCDLQTPFLEGPGAIPGAWSFGLKEVARALGNSRPELAVHWPGDLDEGLRAMVMGWRAYSNPNPIETDEMKILQEYLEVDCAALAAVLKWLRT